MLIPAALCVVVIRLINRWYLIRIGVLHSERIGHLAGNTEIFLSERDIGMHKQGRFGGLDIWLHSGVPCNRQLDRMIGRSLFIDRSGFSRLILLVNGQFHGWERYFAHSDNFDRDINNAMEKTSQHILFTDAEIEKGYAQLAAWGLARSDKWVCLIVRDSAYLPSLTYHNYRDTKIETYRKAALLLADRGYHVFRMGAAVNKPLGIEHPMIADYATNGMRSDFMDIFLTAHCIFAVSTGTGLDAIPSIFRRPICFVNYVPFEFLNTWVRGIAIWKHHWKNGKRMVPEQICNGFVGQFMRDDEFKKARVTLRDNTPDEVADAVSEMADYVEAGCKPKKQINFWRSFPSGTIVAHNGKLLHGKIRLRIGSKFMEAYT